MFENTHSFLSPKLEVRPAGRTAGYGVFAREPIAMGELAAIWSGYIVNYEQLQQLPQEIIMHTICSPFFVKRIRLTVRKMPQLKITPVNGK